MKTRLRALMSFFLPTSPALAVALIGCALIGCGGEPPRIDGVRPLTMIEGEAAEITVTGGGFFWGYDAFGHQLTGEMRILVGDDEVEDFVWLDAATVSGTVPATVAAGIYDVTVETQSGAATREDGFVVRPPQLSP